MLLTDISVKRAAPKDKRYMLSDHRGLYLEVLPSGKKSWRFRYQLDGKEKKITMGTYPEFSLLEARQMVDEMRRRVAHGEPALEAEKRTFKVIAEEWLETRIVPIRSPKHVETVQGRLNRHINPVIGNSLMSEILPQEILSLCRKLESAGTVETAHRIKQIIGQVFRYAIATGEAELDPTYSLQGALRSRKAEHHASLTDPAKISVLVKDITAYPKTILRIAMQFSMLTFARPGEVRHAEWSEVDFERREWKIPAEKMKMRRVHIVPLVDQTIDILKELKPLTGVHKWLFPSARLDGRPMSDNGVRVALRSMGYANEDMTPHGFRSMASTILNENGFAPDVIERQLAHAESNAIRAAYNHAEYMPERRAMMQWWADWIDRVAGA